MAKSDGVVGIVGATPGDLKMTAMTIATITGVQEPQTGWFLANGAAVSRTTYADLFAQVGTAYGVGDGTTTFNLPNLQQKFPMGQAQSGTGNVLGATGGSIDHTHTISHTHDMGNHTHTIAHTHTMAHTHDLSNHTHQVAGHQHSVGAHTHFINSGSWDGISNYAVTSTLLSGGITITQGTAGSSASVVNQSHTHAVDIFGSTNSNSSFNTAVNATQTSTGPSNNSTGAASVSTTSAASAANSGTPSTNTTSTPSVANSGTNNPPFVVVNYLIKY